RWASTASTDRPSALTLRLSHSGLRRATSPSSVVHTGVKFFGWLKKMVQDVPAHSWKRMGPCVLCCSKSGAVWPSCNDIVSSCRRRGVVESIVEMAALDHLGHVAGTDGEVAERFARVPFVRIARKQAVERLEDRRFPRVLEIHPVETLAVRAAAEIQVVLARRATGQANLRDVRARAPVRTAAH